MRRYSKMQAPPFWMWMFRIAGVLCLVTLLTPSFYLLKYALVDHPNEQRIAATTGNMASLLSAQAFLDGTELYIATAEGKGDTEQRMAAVRDLGDLAASKIDQVSRPVECLHAKLALEQVALNDPDAEVRSTAKSTLMRVASNGAIIER